MRDVMVDIETLGVGEGAVVVQIGAVAFDADAGTLGNCKTWDLDFTTEQRYRSIEPETLAWWMQQDAAAIRQVLGVHALDRVSCGTALAELADWVASATRVWARGPQFDLHILNSLSSEYGYGPGEYIKWYKWRDERPMRDLLDEMGYGRIPSGTQHRAVDDAMNQAQNVLRVYELMRNKGARA